MKTFERQCAQGDVLFTRLDARPTELGKAVEPENGNIIITHSETGHHHVMSPHAVAAFQHAVNPFILFVKVERVTELTHLREHHTHEAIEFKPGWYRVNRQREFRNQAIQRAID